MPKASITESSIVMNSLPGIANLSVDDWKKLGTAHILLTGGTGFFGSWIIASFLELRKMGFPIELTVLSRDPDRFLEKNPGLKNHAGLAFRKGDVKSATIPFSISHIVHLATSDRDAGNTAVEGTRHMLNEAKRVGAVRFLLASSGAVYSSADGGRGSAGGAAESSYVAGQAASVFGLTPLGKAKREAESLCHQASTARDIETVVARGFTFCGPLFPTEGPYAISIFMHAMLNGLPLPVKTPDSVRSFLDGRDLATALWKILGTGKNGEAYNVGSAECVTMSELADITRSVAWKASLRVPEIRRPAVGVVPVADVYRPSIVKLQTELGWSQAISLRESLLAQAKWALE